MTKKELIKSLNNVYVGIENALEDQSVMTVGKVIENLKDELGSIIQDVEDENINNNSNELEE